MLYRDIMHRLRQYTHAVEANNTQTANKISGLDVFKGSKYYTDECSTLKASGEAQRVNLGEACKKDLSGYLERMRANVKKGITKAPTTDMAAQLQILGQLEGLSIRDVEMYADQMKECPLALRRLQQIAEANHIRLTIPDAASLLDAIDMIEDRLAQFLNAFRGDTKHSPSVIERALYPILKLDDSGVKETPFKTLERADREAFTNVLLDKNFDYPLRVFEGDVVTPKCKLFFSDLNALRKYIADQTKDLSGVDATAKTDAILKDCPDQYGAAWRYYQGQKDKLTPAEIDSIQLNPTE